MKYEQIFFFVFEVVVSSVLGRCMLFIYQFMSFNVAPQWDDHIISLRAIDVNQPTAKHEPYAYFLETIST